mmetsp:Transcript_45507/g.145102  ORF Transcript_45507/g.145102 Transcript_45507/m.145102 type:complete len:289 (-) Transcript_45507:632-1498(-)
MPALRASAQPPENAGHQMRTLASVASGSSSAPAAWGTLASLTSSVSSVTGRCALRRTPAAAGASAAAGPSAAAVVSAASGPSAGAAASAAAVGQSAAAVRRGARKATASLTARASETWTASWVACASSRATAASKESGSWAAARPRPLAMQSAWREMLASWRRTVSSTASVASEASACVTASAAAGASASAKVSAAARASASWAKSGPSTLSLMPTVWGSVCGSLCPRRRPGPFAPRLSPQPSWPLPPRPSCSPPSAHRLPWPSRSQSPMLRWQTRSPQWPASLAAAS